MDSKRKRKRFDFSFMAITVTFYFLKPFIPDQLCQGSGIHIN